MYKQLCIVLCLFDSPQTVRSADHGFVKTETSSQRQ